MDFAGGGGGPVPAAPSENLYIQGLPLELDENGLRATFAQYGAVAQSKLLEPVPGKADRVGLVRMGSVAEAAWIVDNVHGNIPNGLTNPVSIQFSLNKAQKEVDARKAAGVPPPSRGHSNQGLAVPPPLNGAAAGGYGAPVGGLQTGVMMAGTVKRWDIAKGFGFIVPNGGGPDVFVHAKELSDGEVLVNGSQVMFEAMLDTMKGTGKYRAKNCIGAISKEASSTNPASDKLFVTGLPLEITEDVITTLFNQYGTVASVKKLPTHPGKTDSAALIRMADVSQAKWLLDNVHQNIPSGLVTPVNITYAESKGQSAGQGVTVPPPMSVGQYGKAMALDAAVGAVPYGAAALGLDAATAGLDAASLAAVQGMLATGGWPQEQAPF